MFEKTITTYILYEGINANNNDMVTEFKNKEKALKAFNLSIYNYAVIHQYEGPADDLTANYRDTIAERLLSPHLA